MIEKIDNSFICVPKYIMVVITYIAIMCSAINMSCSEMSKIYTAIKDDNISYIEKNITNDTIDAYIYKLDVNGNNIYVISSHHGRLEIMEYLESLGIDVKHIQHKNSYGNDAYLHAAVKGYTHILRHLDKIEFEKQYNNNRMSAFLCAAEGGNLDTLKYCLQESDGKDIYNRDSYGNNALLTAVSHDNYSIVKHLVEELDFDITSCNYNNDTTYHIATIRDNVDIMRYLDECGIRDKLKTINTSQFVTLAIQYSSVGALRYLDYMGDIDKYEVSDKIDHATCRMQNSRIEVMWYIRNILHIEKWQKWYYTLMELAYHCALLARDVSILRCLLRIFTKKAINGNTKACYQITYSTKLRVRGICFPICMEHHREILYKSFNMNIDDSIIDMVLNSKYIVELYHCGKIKKCSLDYYYHRLFSLINKLEKTLDREAWRDKRKHIRWTLKGNLKSLRYLEETYPYLVKHIYDRSNRDSFIRKITKVKYKRVYNQHYQRNMLKIINEMRGRLKELELVPGSKEFEKVLAKFNS